MLLSPTRIFFLLILLVSKLVQRNFVNFCSAGFYGLDKKFRLSRCSYFIFRNMSSNRVIQYTNADNDISYKSEISKSFTFFGDKNAKCGSTSHKYSLKYEYILIKRTGIKKTLLRLITKSHKNKDICHFDYQNKSHYQNKSRLLFFLLNNGIIPLRHYRNF